MRSAQCRESPGRWRPRGTAYTLTPLLTDRGFTPQSAAFAASALGAATLVGRVVTGWLLDRWQAASVSAILFANGAAGVFGLGLLATPEWAFASVALIGLGMGAEADVIPYLLSRHFDMESFSELYGFSFSAFALAGVLGPLLMGRAFDLAGSYDSVLPFLGRVWWLLYLSAALPKDRA
ncbi:MAG: MFS transporter [Bryobacteraceae bacterium]